MSLLLMLFISPAFAAGNATIRLVAITGNGSGVITSLDVETGPGAGRTLMVTVPLIGIDTQNSERVAAEIAGKVTKLNLSKTDIIFTIHSEAGSVDGPSAGAAMTIATIAALTGRRINPNVLVTGTIEPDGTVGPVGGVLAKARSAAAAGATEFLIPSGTRIQVEQVRTITTPSPGVHIESNQTVRTDVVQYGKEKLGLEVLEVGSINQVIREMFSGYNATLPEIRMEEIPLPLQDYSENERDFRDMAERSIRRARDAVGASGNASAFGVRLAEAQRLFDMNYFYSAANEAFLLTKDAEETYYNVTELRGDVESMLASVGGLVTRLNSTVGLRINSMALLAPGEQRYLWARFYYENADPSDINSLLSAREWLYAAQDILGSAGGGGPGSAVPLDSLNAKAGDEMSKAVDAMATAQASGADTYLAERSLALANHALSQGLPLAAIYDAIDSQAYANAEGFEGTLPELVDVAQGLQINATDPWAENYAKHSVYLIHRASVLNSPSEARSAIFLALRAIGVEGALKVFPAAVTGPAGAPDAPPRPAGKLSAKDVFLVAMCSLSLVVSGYSLCWIRRLEKKMDSRRGGWKGRAK